MSTKTAKRKTGHELHIIGRDIDTYRTIWEGRETGSWFVLFYGDAYEVSHSGASEKLSRLGYRTCIG